MDVNRRRKPYWNRKYGKGIICGITQARLRPGENKYGLKYCITLNCGHSFYRRAIVAWVQNCIDSAKEPTCPLCRNLIDQLKLF